MGQLGCHICLVRDAQQKTSIIREALDKSSPDIDTLWRLKVSSITMEGTLRLPSALKELYSKTFPMFNGKPCEARRGFSMRSRLAVALTLDFSVPYQVISGHRESGSPMQKGFKTEVLKPFNYLQSETEENIH